MPCDFNVFNFIYVIYIFQIISQLSLDTWSRECEGQVSSEMKVGAEERDSGNYLGDSGIYGAALWKVKMGFLAEGCRRETFCFVSPA